MAIEGLVEVAVPFEGAPWDYAAFAAIVDAAGGRFSYLDVCTVLDGIRLAPFQKGISPRRRDFGSGVTDRVAWLARTVPTT